MYNRFLVSSVRSGACFYQLLPLGVYQCCRFPEPQISFKFYNGTMESNTNMFKGDLDKKPKEKKPKQLTTDGGVVKEALKKKSKTTNDMDKVAFGAEVIVTYEGRIGGPDGAAFEKKENALLQLDKGQVLSGLEIAIKSMKKGEKARFTIKSEYGYGKDGNAELNVPADAVLSYVIELVSVVNQIWLTMDGGIRKKVLKEAPAADPMAGPQMTPPPDYEGTMHVHLIGRRSDGSEFQNTYKEGKEYTFVQGEGEAIIGLDKVVKSMKKGETCLLFLTAPYAFGEAGKPEWNIAPNSNVSYEVELVAYEKGRDHFWDTHSFEDKYSEALKRRELGNKYWEQGNIRCACKKYKKATKFLEYDSDFTAEEKEKSNALKIICFNNLAAAKVKTGKWHKVIQIASAVLQMDPNNVKALYRRAKGLNNIKEWDHARTDIKKALELDPNNVDVKRELVDINKRQKEYDSTDAKAMKKLLSEMAAEREEKERKEKQIAEAKQRIEDAKKRKAMMVYGGYGLVAILILYILFTVFFRGSS